MNTHSWMLDFGDADVRLSAGAQRYVFPAPLYLSPAAQKAAVGIGVNSLVSVVKAAKKAGVIPHDNTLGRQAISHVLACYPTLYVKILDTCNLINWHYVEQNKEPPIKGEDIIVCGFRVRDFPQVPPAQGRGSRPGLPELLGLSEAEIAAGAHVDLRLVQSLRSNYRLHLDPVLKIHSFLVHTVSKMPVKEDEDPDLQRLRRGKIEEGVAIDDRQHVNIEKIQNPYGAGDVHLLNDQNIAKAPASGHPWKRKPTSEEPAK